MKTLASKLERFNAGLRYYTVQPVDKAIAEDGKYQTGEGVGYGVINNETNVVEHTSVCLPAILFQATHFDDMLASLVDTKAKLSLVDTPTEDILPN